MPQTLICLQCSIAFQGRPGTFYCKVFCRRQANYVRNKPKLQVAYAVYRKANLAELRAKGRANYHANREGRMRYMHAYKKDRDLRYPWFVPVESAKTRAKQKGFDFNLTPEWAISRWTGRCELSGIPFRVFPHGHGPAPYSASIDRIDNSKGYIQTNCRFVLLAVNSFKHTGTDADIAAIAAALITPPHPQNIVGVLGLPG